MRDISTFEAYDCVDHSTKHVRIHRRIAISFQTVLVAFDSSICLIIACTTPNCGFNSDTSGNASSTSIRSCDRRFNSTESKHGDDERRSNFDSHDCTHCRILFGDESLLLLQYDGDTEDVE